MLKKSRTATKVRVKQFAKLSTYLLMIIMLSACVVSNKRSQYVQVFNPKNIGQKYIFDVDVSESADYMLDFQIYNSKTIYEKNSGTSSEEINAFSELRKPYDKKLPITFDVLVLNKNTNKVIFKQKVVNPETGLVGSGWYATLMYKTLDKGQYIIYATYIEGDKKLDEFYSVLHFLERRPK